MPLFFFDFRQDQEHSSDIYGLQFADAEEAYLEAFEAAREMWADLMARRCDPRRCAFEVRSAKRELLFVLPFQEVLDSCRARGSSPSLGASFQNATRSADRARRACDAFGEELRAMRATLAQSRGLLLEPVEMNSGRN